MAKPQGSKGARRRSGLNKKKGGRLRLRVQVPWRERCEKTGKLRYPDEHQAVREIYRSRERKNTLQKPLRQAYPCKHCHDWHTSSQEEFDPGFASGKGLPGWVKYGSRLIAPL